MKHLKSFETETAFDSEKSNIDLPWVTLTEDDSKVHFSCEIINEDDLTKGDFIDLGLPSGTKWASCNLGATNPCDYGDYYMWGSVTPNTDTICDWEYTPYHQGWDYNINWLKYHPSVDNKIVLDLEDDASYVATSGKAHIPTKEQIQELIDNTTVKWTTINGVNGSKFTSSNGNSIFIPAAGYREKSYFIGQDGCGLICSSSRDIDKPYYIYFLEFYSDSFTMSTGSRCGGLTVRPVSES